MRWMGSTGYRRRKNSPATLQRPSPWSPTERCTLFT
jgi:hypothetical protein